MRLKIIVNAALGGAIALGAATVGHAAGDVGASEPTGNPPVVVLAASDLDPATVKLGKRLAARKGCASCHSADGKKKAGPTWMGLFGNERVLADGSTVLADETYLVQSILDPDSQIAEGFAPKLMPGDYRKKLKEEDLQALVDYIKSLQ